MARVSEKPRVLSYRFTVESKDDIALLNLKEEVKQHNKARKRLEEWSKRGDKLIYQQYVIDRFKKTPKLRVRLMPRGPRAAAARANNPKPYLVSTSRAYDCYLPQRHATHFDVYVHEVR